MKKTLLAAALLAGFAGAAQAETSVTLYGVVDVGVGYQQIKGRNPATDNTFGTTKVGMLNGVQSGSRWGLRGVEDLGDGLRAMFNLESGFNSNNGINNRLFGRRVTVGLSGDTWGRVDFGRQMNIASQYFDSIDPFELGYGQSNMGTVFGAATLRYDNSVMFQTPTFNDFQFGVGYSFNANDQEREQTDWRTADNSRAITAGLRYANGPVNLALTYDQLNVSDRYARKLNSKATPKQWMVGGSYDFEAFKLALAFGQARDGWFASQDLSAFSIDAPNPLLDRLRVDSYMVGASAPLGGGSKLFASWLMADPKNMPADRFQQWEKWQVYSLGYTYDFSKRTNLYAMGSFSKNYAFVNELKSTAFGIGVRHRF